MAPTVLNFSIEITYGGCRAHIKITRIGFTHHDDNGISTFTCSAARNVTKHLIMATGTKEQSAFGVTSCCKFHASYNMYK
uniref:Uncharacterized protein n=1 Tax=Solanum lycopersicum TaxID=4081 RepID=A0A3Q7HK26_SOLLC